MKVCLYKKILNKLIALVLIQNFTGQLMLWSILSRRLSAFPHEGGYLELAESASPFIQKAARGEWSEADTEAWLQMVKTTIPEGTPSRSATSNANDFGKVFFEKNGSS